jgi:hypothetical protein
LHLITPLSSKVQVELYNSLGQLIVNESYTLDELENHIFGVTLASGVYQAILRQDDYSEVVKVIKN